MKALRLHIGQILELFFPFSSSPLTPTNFGKKTRNREIWLQRACMLCNLDNYYMSNSCLVHKWRHFKKYLQKFNLLINSKAFLIYISPKNEQQRMQSWSLNGKHLFLLLPSQPAPIITFIPLIKNTTVLLYCKTQKRKTRNKMF